MYLSKDISRWASFTKILRRAFKEGKEDQLLALLLTADERDAIGLRLQIVAQLLEKKVSQREIQHNLNTSVATITRGSNMIKTMPAEFMVWLKEQLNEAFEKEQD